MTQTIRAWPPLVGVTDVRVATRLEEWLASLADLSWMRLAGRDGSRIRIVSALLHGNEPSSARALHRWLLQRAAPATEVWLLFGAVRAALAEPPFTHRFLPDEGDLNRCWQAPFASPSARRAEELLAAFTDCDAEALLDLHNNTGHNPPYGVGPRDDPAVLGLVSLFGELFVHSPLRMGTLVEATAPCFPSAAIECGRSGDPAADDVAFRGLRRFLELDSLAGLHAEADRIRVLGDPIRVTLRPGTRLSFESSPRPDADLTLDPEIDRHNFQPLEPGTRLGWLADGALPLSAHDASGTDRAAELFLVDGHDLRVARPWIPVMMTTDAHAATLDCLFYAVQPRSGPGER